jgi:nicotinic acid phosphoribosyltransferase
VATAKEFGAEGPGAIRIDSGDLAYEAEKARELLDSLGATKTRVTVTSDLDEYVLKDLQDAPIVGYGVGTRLVASQPMGMVYKLVAIQDSPDSEFRPVAKSAKAKKSIGGRKYAFRKYERNGAVSAEVFTTDPNVEIPNSQKVQRVVMQDGKVLWNPSLEETREHHIKAKAELPHGEQKVWSGNDFGPYLTAEHVEG